MLTVEVVRQNDRLDRLDSALQRDAISARRTVFGPRRGRAPAHLRTEGGAALARLALRPDGTGYFVAEGMPRAPRDDTYQLWALVGDPERPTAISAGVLGRDPRVASFRFDGPVVGFAVTQEHAPGVVSSKQPAMLQGTFSEA